MYGVYLSGANKYGVLFGPGDIDLKGINKGGAADSLRSLSPLMMGSPLQTL